MAYVSCLKVCWRSCTFLADKASAKETVEIRCLSNNDRVESCLAFCTSVFWAVSLHNWIKNVTLTTVFRVVVYFSFRVVDDWRERLMRASRHIKLYYYSNSILLLLALENTKHLSVFESFLTCGSCNTFARIECIDEDVEVEFVRRLSILISVFD